MDISIISFTENGIHLSLTLLEKLQEADIYGKITLFTKCSQCRARENECTLQVVKKSVSAWAQEQLQQKNALLFIGACGIAVRAIAPYITDKLHDSPVLVMDEMGQYVIPLLSGHIGGANELALFIAKNTGAEPVITTATDLNHRFAVDLFAKKNGLAIADKSGIAKVSSKVLSGASITVSVEPKFLKNSCSFRQGMHLIPYPPTQQSDIVISSEKREFNATLCLIPKEFVIGIGCKKGKEAVSINDFIQQTLNKLGISQIQIATLASIDIKKTEPGLLAWSREKNIPFVTYTAETLQQVRGTFQQSDFVRSQVGVDNVCERAALKACGIGGTLIYEKHAQDGMTIAVAKKEWSVNFDEA